MTTTKTPHGDVVLVTLGNSPKKAQVHRDDLERVKAAGYTGAWFLNGCNGYSYVRTGRSDLVGRLESVARIIAEAKPGQIVKYRDGDRLNLRRDNLYLGSGRSKARRWTEATEELR